MRITIKISICLWLVSWVLITTPHRIETLYGTTTITEPVMGELLVSRAVQRLKEIHQYGVVHYIHPMNHAYDRYTHSVGVLYLLRYFGAALEEQIAGLLHDVSHTVFSHVGDHISAQLAKKTLNQNDEAYQDNMHLWHLAHTDVAPLLARYGIGLEAINHKNGSFAMLERPLPDLCADRLEYNLYGAYAEGWIDREQVRDIIATLHYEKGVWFFDDVLQARRLAEISLRLCTEIFASVWNIAAYEWAAKALLRAVQTGLLSFDDIHFGHDDAVWELLQGSTDQAIAEAVGSVQRAQTLYMPANPHHYDLCYTGKCRGINPWVKTEQGLQRLTDIDESFAQLFHEAKAQIEQKRYCVLKT
jgi:HD superfamily phosphohydrolase